MIAYKQLLLTHLILARRRSSSLKGMVVSISCDVTDFLITDCHNSLVPLSKVELNLITALVSGGIALVCNGSARLHSTSLLPNKAEEVRHV